MAQARDDINAGYLQKFSIGSDVLRGEIGVPGDAPLARALEQLELTLFAGTGEWTRHGLGYNNAQFMPAELLLLGNSATGKPPVQVILTTHSPNLAAAIPVEHLTLVARGSTFRLVPGLTRLDEGDYAFLTRFLDVTKANLFFARSVAIVEGDAEAIVLPALAQDVGRSFNECGVSVGGVGLFRYSRIFQRDGEQLPVAVACIRDRYLVPVGTSEEIRKKLKCSGEMTAQQITDHVAALTAKDSGHVRTFVSDHWTLEYDLAAAVERHP